MEWYADQNDLKISLPTLQTTFAVTFSFTSKVTTLAMGFRWCLSSGLSLSVRISIQDEAMDVAQSAPQEAHY